MWYEGHLIFSLERRCTFRPRGYINYCILSSVLKRMQLKKNLKKDAINKTLRYDTFVADRSLFLFFFLRIVCLFFSYKDIKSKKD